MKIGLHVGEPLNDIVARKLAEEHTVGVTYWGYGGTVCHPTRQVQPFARLSDEPVAVLMIRTPSDFFGDASAAVSQSTDGLTWEPVPRGIRTTGGKYALVLRALQGTDEQLDLGAYEVGIGPKTGTPLINYLRGRVDKACAQLTSQPREPQPVHIVLRAELVPPYAVILRTTFAPTPTRRPARSAPSR